MSNANVSAFIKALEAVKEGYTCVVCNELCKEPVTLSKCFHIICSQHFQSLKSCPKCHVSLVGCTTFTDDRMEACIKSTIELDEMLKPYKIKEQLLVTEKPVIGDKADDIKKIKQTKKGSQKEDLNISITGNLEKRNYKGETMLHIACRVGNIDKVSQLLKQGANPNTKDNAGWTPLHEVVQNNRLDIVRILLHNNTLVNVPGPSNETPLHEAVRYGHIDIAEELVKYGADVNARNYKGETPLQLANTETRGILEAAADNIVQTQSVNISHISAVCSELDYEPIRICNASQFRTVANKLKSLIKHHGNVQVETKFTKNVTHLLVDVEPDGVCMLSVEVLQAIVYGIWVINSTWVTNSTEEKLEPFESYEVKGVGSKNCEGPMRSRYNRYKQLPGIFNGCHFYLHNFHIKYDISKTVVLTKAILTKLITDGGGVVLRRVPNPELIPESEKLVPYHARKDGKLANCSHYIIFKDVYEPMYNMSHLKALPVGWLIDCIERYELCETW